MLKAHTCVSIAPSTVSAFVHFICTIAVQSVVLCYCDHPHLTGDTAEPQTFCAPAPIYIASSRKDPAVQLLVSSGMSPVNKNIHPAPPDMYMYHGTFSVVGKGAHFTVGEDLYFDLNIISICKVILCCISLDLCKHLMM